mmetsp:Transcript_106637/g.227722  ORF Transcript_106637/g.227722 Transcript_106637/m.227722 type:complete len:490 (-) Transcript_106637:127-1596(-)
MRALVLLLHFWCPAQASIENSTCATPRSTGPPAAPLHSASLLQVKQAHEEDQHQAALSKPERPPSEEDDSRSVVVEFATGRHYTAKNKAVKRTAANKNGFKWVRRSIFGRAEAQKALRCHNSSSASCEECWGKTDCWFGHRNMRKADGSNWQMWKRIVQIMHLRCDLDSVAVSFKLKSIVNGTLRAFWDEVEVTPQNGFHVQGHMMSPVSELNSTPGWASNKKGHTGYATLPLPRKGAHELLLEFSPTGPNALVVATNMRMFVSKAFARCEDVQTCLASLGTGQLRNSNTQQLECLLADPPTGNQCVKWRKCLDKASDAEDAEGDHRSHLITLLMAAGVGNAELGTELGTLMPWGGDSHAVDAYASDPVSEEKHCMDPRLEDPEAWECDCYEEAKQQCMSLTPTPEDTSLAQCLRAHYCMNRRVCSEWKASFCTSSEVTHFIEALNAQSASWEDEEAVSQSLLERSSVAQRDLGASNQLDQSLGGKHCV